MHPRTILAAALLLAAAGGEAAAATVVIGHPGSTPGRLDPELLSHLYLGRKRQFPGGGRCEPVLLAGGGVHERFCEERLGLTPASLASTWKRLVFVGQGRQPATFSDPAEAVAYVAATPGAIAYVDEATPRAGVQVIAIER